MKTILSKIEWHYTYLVLAFSLVMTGYFVNLLVFTSLIVIHELGHIVAALIMHFRIKKIVIYPYGGMIQFDMPINQKINEEFSMAVAGVIFQSVYFVLISCLYQHNVIRDYTYQLFIMYHYSMLWFNLMPIYPLDGAKMVNLLISKYLPYYMSNVITAVISVMGLGILIIATIGNGNYSYLMMISVIIYNIVSYVRSLKYLFQKFIVERYLYNYDYRQMKRVKVIRKMYKNKKHLFIVGNREIDEKKYLRERYGK